MAAWKRRTGVECRRRQMGSYFGVWNTSLEGPIFGQDQPAGGLFPNGSFASYLAMFAPVYHGFALLGELSKWVAVSPVRFSELQVAETMLQVQLAGAMGEVVRVAVLTDVGLRGMPVVHGVRVPAAGRAVRVSRDGRAAGLASGHQA
eukprot:5591801-Prymnesium_polylepis.2